MADRIHYGGEWKWAKKVTDLLNEGGGGGASELDDLQDVTLINPTTGQALVFDGTKWVNADVAGTQEQADWAQTDTTAVDYIKNKPTIPPTLTASGNIEIDSNVIKRKEVWLTMAEYTALQNPDANTDYHITDGTYPVADQLPITVVNGKLCYHFRREVT